MKKVLHICTVLCILCILAFNVSFMQYTNKVYAEEAEQVEVIENTEEHDLAELEAKINAIKNNLKSTKVYKWLTCGLTGLLVALGSIFVKTWGKLKTYKSAFKISEETKVSIESLLQTYSVDEIKTQVIKTVKQELHDELEKILKESQLKDNDLVKLISSNQVIKAQLDKIVNALLLAWNNKVEGVSNILSEPADEKTYEAALLENKLLKEELAKKAGEQAIENAIGG